MLKLVTVGTIVAMAIASPINQNMVNQIRSQSAWTAHDVETNPLKDYTPEMLQNLLGTHIAPVNGFYGQSEIVSVPADFDART
jgi:hypothetical protein